MPTHRQNMVESKVTEKGLGTVSSQLMKATFSKSPVWEMSDDERRKFFQDHVMTTVVNDGGHTFGTFNTEYVDAPNMKDVKTGGGGLPASPYVPNPTSPGPGSTNATDQPEADSSVGKSPSDTFGTGIGSQLSPNVSSERIAQQTLGDYIMGKAYTE